MKLDVKAIDTIKESLIQNKQKLSVAESVTAGLLQASIATAEFALKFFEGGITTYNINQKVKHLNIDRETGERFNCVSEITAREMAVGVCNLFHTDWGIAVTGYATAVPESENKLFAYYAICFRENIVVTERIDLDKNLEAEDAQMKYVNRILNSFSTYLVSKRPSPPAQAPFAPA